ncbi:MAG: ABC transporter permease [Jatrophihabitans sp.]
MVTPQNIFEVDETGDDSDTPLGEAGPAPTREYGRSGLIIRRFIRSKSGLLGLVLLVVIAGIAIVGPMLIKFGPAENDFANTLSKPGVGGHILGTDASGRDILVRTLIGLRKSLAIGFFAAIITTSIAAVAGSSAGYFGKWVDAAIVWVIDLLLVLPAFLVLAILSPILGTKGTTTHWYTLGVSPSIWFLIILLSIFGWMITGRVIRGMTFSLREREYVAAARFMGVPARTIITRHLLPNMASLLIVDVTINVAGTILAETGLSFFGFGVQPPDVSLGTVLNDNQNFITTASWTILPACFALIALLLSVNLVGDALRDAIDPTSGASRL